MMCVNIYVIEENGSFTAVCETTRTFGQGKTLKEALKKLLRSTDCLIDYIRSEHPNDWEEHIKSLPPELLEKERSDAWFWSKEWQKGEKRVDKLVAEGQTIECETINDMIAFLRDKVKEKEICDCKPATHGGKPELDIPEDIAIHLGGSHRKTRKVYVDGCIAHVIQHLWANKIITLSCCCGHNERNPDIVVDGKLLSKFHYMNKIFKLIKEVDDREWEVSQWELISYEARYFYKENE